MDTPMYPGNSLANAGFNLESDEKFPIKVLFVCSRNRRRSLTAEQIFKDLPNLQVRSAGTQPAARIVITEGMLGWADITFVMEKAHLRRLEERFPAIVPEKAVIALHIPDEFEFMQSELIDELQAKVLPILEDFRSSGRDKSGMLE